MAKDPAYPMYAQDFDMDTASWPVTAVGIHVRLLNYSWINGPLPDDTEALSRIVRLDHGNFRKLWIRIVTGKWTKTEEGLVNSRMELEREKRRSFVESQRLRANRRWNSTDAAALPTDEPSNMPATCNSFSSSISFSSSKESKNKERKTRKNVNSEKKKYLDSVYLSDHEYDRLLQSCGQAKLSIGIEKLDYSISVKGGRFKDHYKTILHWDKQGWLTRSDNAKNRNSGKEHNNSENKGERYEVDSGEYPIDIECNS